MALIDILARMGLDAADFTRGLGDARRRTNSFSQDIGEMLGSISWKTFAAGAAIAAGGIGLITKSLIDFADELSDTSENVNLSTTKFQQLTYAFQGGGTKANEFAKAFETLNGKIEDAQSGKKEAIELFEKLGISIEDLKSQSTEQIFFRSADALKALNNESKANAIANDLLGKGAKTMAGLYRQGADAIRDAYDGAYIASNKAISRLGWLSDKIDQTAKNAKALGVEMVAFLADMNFNPLPNVAQPTNYNAIADRIDARMSQERKAKPDDPKEVEEALKNEVKYLEELNKLRKEAEASQNKLLTDKEKYDNNAKQIERLELLRQESAFEAEQLRYQIQINALEKENQDIGKRTLKEVHEEREKILSDFNRKQKAVEKEYQDMQKKSLDIRKDEFSTMMETLDLEELSSKEVRDGLANQEKIAALKKQISQEDALAATLRGDAKDQSENYSRELKKQLTGLETQTAEMEKQERIRRGLMDNPERRAEDRADRARKREEKSIAARDKDAKDRLDRGSRLDKSNLPGDKRPDQAKDSQQALADLKVDTSKMVTLLESIQKLYGNTI